MIKKEFKVEGMCCPNCVTHIQSALEKVANFSNIDVQVNEAKVVVNLKDEVENTVLIDAINNAGHYQVVS